MHASQRASNMAKHANALEQVREFGMNLVSIACMYGSPVASQLTGMHRNWTWLLSV